MRWLNNLIDKRIRFFDGSLKMTHTLTGRQMADIIDTITDRLERRQRLRIDGIVTFNIRDQVEDIVKEVTSSADVIEALVNKVKVVQLDG